jgi:hypothetical protein
MKIYVGMQVWLHTFLTSALYGGEKSPSCPGTHWTGGSVSPSAGLGMAMKRKTPCPSQELKPGHVNHSLVTILSYSYSNLKNTVFNCILHTHLPQKFHDHKLVPLSLFFSLKLFTYLLIQSSSCTHRLLVQHTTSSHFACCVDVRSCHRSCNV